MARSQSGVADNAVVQEGHAPVEELVPLFPPGRNPVPIMPLGLDDFLCRLLWHAIPLYQ
jgi:hypothetical protein